MTPAIREPGPKLPAGDERRRAPRKSTDFYMIELRGASRYFRLVRNISATGLLFENPMADEEPGQLIDLELPRMSNPEPLKVKAEVVYVTRRGQVGVKLIDRIEPIETLGGKAAL